MLQSAILIASLASVALSGVANVCVLEPYRQMQDFRGFDPAVKRCEAHYPVETVTKTLANQCLTTTKTVITGTSTVHVTNHSPCPTEQAHLEVRAKGTKAANKSAKKSSKQSKASARKSAHSSKVSSKKSVQSSKKSVISSKKSVQSSKKSASKTSTTTTTPGASIVPRDLTHHAGPTPAAVLKREVMATKTADWSSYYASLVDCGYECIQTACSCVASPNTVLQTPKPTCTSTETKETIVHETTTIEIDAEHCY